MCLNIGRPISDQSIARSVRLVKTVVGELFKVIPEFFDFSTIGVRMFNGTLNKLALHFFHKFDIFLTNGFSKRIRLATGKSANFLRNLHKLLLINQNSVSVFKGIRHMIFVESNFFFSVLSGDKFWNFAHRTRSIQRHHRDNVFELSWFQFAQIAFHSSGFKLKNTSRITTCEKLVSFFIIKTQSCKINIDSVSFFDDFLSS